MCHWSKTPSGKSRPGSKDTRRRHPPCVRVRFISAANWWLRSPYCNSNNGATNALNVNTNGNWSNNNCSNAGYAIRPALVLPSSLLVSDDGSVQTNTAPTTPASITIPENVEGGKSIAVSWSAATDKENNLEGYVVERSVDGGGTKSEAKRS